MITPPALPFEYHRIAEQVLAELKGVRYLHRGLDPARGLDCRGHIYTFYRLLGLPMYIPPEGKHYPPDFWRNGVGFTYMNALIEQFQWIPARSAQFSDLVVFESKSGTGKICHTGIMLDVTSGEFQHAVRNRRVGVGRTDERFWQQRVAGFMRHRRMGVLVENAKQMPREVKV